MTLPGDPSDSSDAVFEYGRDDRDDDGILDPEQAMGDDSEDVLADGWSPPDEPGGVDEYGTTVTEQRTGERLDDRELRTLPETWSDPDTDPVRADRLVDTDDGSTLDTEADLVAREAAGDDDLSPEEAAIHRIDPDPSLETDPGAVAVDEGATNA
ncbi:MAG: DUF5709 domain-containing protein [Kineosporiaceae bacterium]